MLGLKKPKTFDEQIEILKQRGLIIKDENYAKFFLKNVNYYRFTAYLITFKSNDDKYINSPVFENIIQIYKFDTHLRSLLMEMIGNIEISFRAYVAYTLSINYDTLGYLDKNNFINEKFHKKFLLRLEQEKTNNSNKLFIKHHNDNYDGKIPIWVATEIMTFGMLSKLYSNMLPGDKTYIKNNLCKVNPTLVNTWLQSLTHIRNQCAHYGRIYNTIFPDVKIKKEYKQYNIDKKSIFANILAMKHLNSDSELWKRFVFKLQELINEYSEFIELKLIGFPENWLEILFE